MPIVVQHTPVLQIAQAAQGVGAYNAARQGAADQRANDAQALDRQRFEQSIVEAANQRAFQQAQGDRQFAQQQQLQRSTQDNQLMQSALQQQNGLQDMLLKDALGSQSQADQQAFDLQKLNIQGKQQQDLARTRAELTGQNDIAVQNVRNQPKLMDQQTRQSVADYIDANTGNLFTATEAARAKVNLMAGGHSPIDGELMPDFVRRLADKTAASETLQYQREDAASGRQQTAIDAADTRQLRGIGAQDQRQQRTIDAQDARATDSGTRADAQLVEREARSAFAAQDRVAAGQVQYLQTRLRQIQTDPSVPAAELQHQSQAITDQIQQLIDQRNKATTAYTTMTPAQYLQMVRGSAAPTTRPATQPAAPELQTQGGTQDADRAARNLQHADEIPVSVATQADYDMLLPGTTYTGPDGLVRRKQ